MTPTLHEIGAALYGPRWQTPLARDLGVADRTVRRWATGQPLPPGVRTHLLMLVATRAEELNRLSHRLRDEMR